MTCPFRLAAVRRAEGGKRSRADYSCERCGATATYLDLARFARDASDLETRARAIDCQMEMAIAAITLATRH
jgi:hypothetical protein